MKNIYKITAIVAALFVVTTGCNKYLDINSNPAFPQTVKAEILLPPIEFQMANGPQQDFSRAISKITQNWAGVDDNVASLNWEKQGYVSGSDVGGVVWRMVYFDLGINLENMINDAVANQKYEYAGIGYAIKAWAYQQGTDEYGPLNITDAFTPGKLTYTYQDQPDVYAKVHEWGDLAIKYLNMTSPVSYTAQLTGPTGDGIYKGDKAKWKKFVYALYILQYGHLVNKTEYKTQYVDSITKYIPLSFANETEDASVPFTAASVADSNPWGPLNGGSSTSGLQSVSTYYSRQTVTILGLLSGGVKGTPTVAPTVSADPRFSRFLWPGLTVSTTNLSSNGSLTYSGVNPVHGSGTATIPGALGFLPTGALSYNGKYIFTDRARFPLMTYSQLQFALAEALFIKAGNVGTTAAVTAYRNGILASFDFYNQYGRTANIPDPVIPAVPVVPATVPATADIQTYMASSEVVQLATPNLLTIADIMQQKYIAQWGWGGLETWCDLRKYHFSPTVFRTFVQLPTADFYASNGGKYMYRMRPRYNSEYVWNAAELAKWGGLNANYNTQELWFSIPN